MANNSMNSGMMQNAISTAAAPLRPGPRVVRIFSSG
jgi:hypothetical protein